GAGAHDEDVRVDVPVLVRLLVPLRVEDAEVGQVVRLQALGDRDAGGRQHRFGDVAGVPGMHADEGVGLFNAGAQDAAGPSQVGRGAAVQATGRDEGAGDRVADVSGVGGAVDGEGDRATGVDPGGTGQTGGGRHRA